MEVSLLYRKKEFDWKKKPSKIQIETFADFKMDVLLNSMSEGNQFVYECCEKVLMERLNAKDEITYRQAVLADCIENPSTVWELFTIAQSAIDEIILNRRYILINDFPSVVLNNSIEKLWKYMEKFIEIRQLLLGKVQKFKSEGFVKLIRFFREEITEEFLVEAKKLLVELSKLDRISIDVSLGVGYRATDYKLCSGDSSDVQKGKSSDSTSRIAIHPSDTKSIGYLLDLKQKGLEETADIIACVTDEVSKFFLELQRELAFYCGCCQIYSTLHQLGAPITFPKVSTEQEHQMQFEELYDVGLALSQQNVVVGNSMKLDEYNLILITGANQGGKSTFLRSVGLGQIMFQAGMFVGAKQFEGSLKAEIYTHFRKDEDRAMNHGKLEDELRRFRELVEVMEPNSILMCNESFSSTNEREGTEIALPLIRAFREQGIQIFFVTHFYSLPKQYQKDSAAIILQAERKEDGSRSFRLVEKEMSETSYAMDLYDKLFT